MDTTDYDWSTEESSNQSSLNDDSYESDDDNFDYFSSDSSSEDDPSDNDMVSIPDGYSLEDGADGDDDTEKCCHWSKKITVTKLIWLIE